MPGIISRDPNGRLAGVALLLVLITGCGGPQADYSKVGLVQVGGTVTLDGSPLAGAVVTFEDEHGQFSYALTDATGRYTLRFDSVMNGVTPGAKLIRISTARRIPGLNDSAGGGEAGEERGEPADDALRTGPTERVPARYNTRSELRADVSAATTTQDFALTSAT